MWSSLRFKNVKLLPTGKMKENCQEVRHGILMNEDGSTYRNSVSALAGVAQQIEFWP